MIIYRLEIKEPTTLRVKLEEEGSRRILYLDTLKGLAKAKDAGPLKFLTQLHLRSTGSRSPDTLSFQLIDLPLSHSIEAIRLMGETGQLYFASRKLLLNPKKLNVSWKGEKHSEKSATIRAFLGETPLEAAEVLLGGWVILNGEWSELETKVPWKWIELVRRGPTLIEGVKKKNFLEEEPPIVWKEKEEVPFRSFPQLVLSDLTGSFANLWIDYPGVGRVAFEDLAPNVQGRTRLKGEEASWEKDLLEAGFIRKAVGNSRYYCPGEKGRETLQFLSELGWGLFDSRGRKILAQSRSDLKVEQTGATLSIRGSLRFQDQEGALQKGMEAARKGRLFLEIDEHHVGLLDLKAVPLIEGVWDDEVLKLPKGRIGEVLPLLDREGIEWEAGLKKAAEALRSGSGIEPLFVDARFQGTLFPYQKQGVEWLSFLHKWGFGALLSDEMGLGKTVQVLAFFSQLRTNLPILIVAPTSLLFNWAKEIARFWPEASVYVHSGSNRKQVFGNERVILTSYALLRLDLPLFTRIEFEAIVLDESQAIKTSTSQAAQAAQQIKARFRIAITGTPVENRPEELWSQFRFLAPDLLGSRSDFQAAGVELIRKKIKPFILRRLKKEVQIQLPEKIDHPVWIEMTELQEALYQKTIQEFKSALMKKVQLDGLQAHRMEVLEVILRLRQICCDPRLFGEVERGAKLEQLLLDVESLVQEGKKVLIFSQFTTALRLIERDLKEKGLEPLYLDGSIPAEERGALVERFQSEEKPHLFLLSLKAGGVGLNLTAAESVILFDPWWNEAVERQAIDRAHRIGQKNTLLVQRYLTPHSIEEKMVEMKLRKTAHAQELLGDESSSWRAEDLLHLLT
jgi:superfamily II DNA or RNA helicase